MNTLFFILLINFQLTIIRFAYYYDRQSTAELLFFCFFFLSNYLVDDEPRELLGFPVGNVLLWVSIWLALYKLHLFIDPYSFILVVLCGSRLLNQTFTFT